jgi:hypothetical protein
MNWLQDRLREGSTWAGLSAVMMGVGQLGKVNEAPAVSDALTNVGTAISQGVPWWQALMFGAAGAAIAIADGKKGKK